nr:methylenetetrahydrofolate reductase [Desulfosediminicola flagellatus]
MSTETNNNCHSNLEKVLKGGGILPSLVSWAPPRGTDPAEVKEKAKFLKGNVDSVNITDNQTAVVRMSSWAASLLILEEGLEPNYQMVCRDRNRLAMQVDILGGAAMGIKNMLCLSGDHPDAKGVFDIDSIQLIAMVKQMRDDGLFLSGGEIEHPLKMFIGTASNPFAEPYEWRVNGLAKKIEAGADFIQTQCIYNMDRFREFIHVANEEGLTDQIYILSGDTPMKSIGMARYMKTKVPGMDVPDEIIDRLKGGDKKKVADEGIKIGCEQIEEFRELEGVHGVYMMAIEWEHKVPEIAEQVKVLPRTVFD